MHEALLFQSSRWTEKEPEYPKTHQLPYSYTAPAVSVKEENRWRDMYIQSTYPTFPEKQADPHLSPDLIEWLSDIQVDELWDSSGVKTDCNNNNSIDVKKEPQDEHHCAYLQNYYSYHQMAARPCSLPRYPGAATYSNDPHCHPYNTEHCSVAIPTSDTYSFAQDSSGMTTPNYPLRHPVSH